MSRLEAALQQPAQLAAVESWLRFDNYSAGHPRQPYVPIADPVAPQPLDASLSGLALLPLSMESPDSLALRLRSARSAAMPTAGSGAGCASRMGWHARCATA